MAADPRDPIFSERTLTRRELLGWLGTGAALALGGDLLATTGVAATPDPGFAFHPGSPDAAIYRDWDVRTVDRQDLQAILSGWRLEVDGMVARPLHLSFAEVLALPRTEQTTDLHCVEGWSVFDIPWSGVRLADLLDRAAPLPEATHVHFHTVRDRYNESLPLALAREPKSLLAYGAAGFTLPLEHGFPLRVVVPRLYGYKSAKYVYRLELASKPLEGFWVRNGYDYGGAVTAQRLRPGKY